MTSHIEDDEMGASPEQRLESFLRICLAQLVYLADSEKFLNWVGENGQYLLPEMLTQLTPQTVTPAQLFRRMGREIWEATPLPHKNFCHERLAVPAPDAPCHCGSNRRYGQCCGLLHPAESGMQQMELLPLLLEILPKNRWVELVHSAIPIDAVANAAFCMIEQGAAKEAALLLAPWFGKGAPWPDRLADLLDLLLNAYEILHHPKKRKDLAMQATVLGEPRVAAIGWQRLAAILTDGNDLEGAWDAFNQAQRADPDNLSLAPLEITILISQQYWEQASQRAQFWAARINRMAGTKEIELLDYLHQVARNPQQAMRQICEEMEPAFGILAAVMAEAPSVTCCYVLQPDGSLAGALTPSPAMVQARAAWDAAFPSLGSDPLQAQYYDRYDDIWQAAEQWLPALVSKPILWQDFAVLEELIAAVDSLDMLGLESCVQALTQRAVDLLDCVLHNQQATEHALAWGFVQNRPALRLVARHVFGCRAQNDNVAARLWLRRMVDQLNPDDNQGLRNVLMRDYLQAGDFDHAMALGDRFTKDFGAMRYNRALAYFRGGQVAQANDILRDALIAYPLIGKVLLAKRTAKPKVQTMVAVGSREEASLYRAEHLSLWPADALEWLHAVRKR